MHWRLPAIGLHLLRGGLLAAALLAVSCSDATDPSTPDSSIADAGQDTSPDASPDAGEPSKALFDPTKIVTVEIQMAAADWDTIRKQERDVWDNLMGPGCLSKPWDRPFSYKKATVTVNGVVVKNVGVRKKGFLGSINETKPALKIKFDKYVQDQLLFGMDRLTLNNNAQDFSFMRQCLTYDLFTRAGLPAPRCNFATVKVNGQDLGLYANVESIKKKFLARHFKDNDGNLYEGTLSDFRAGWMATWETKTSSTKSGLGDILAVKAILALPDSEVLAALATLVDLDAFYTFWAMEVLVNHADGYTSMANNFYVYSDPTSKQMHFVPWGADNTLSNVSTSSASAPKHVHAYTALSRRLYLLPTAQAKYVAAMRKLLKDVWVEAKLKAEIDRIEQLIGQVAINDPLLKSSTNGVTFASSVNLVRTFVTNRRAQITPVIDSPPAWTLPLRAKFCEDKGAISTAEGSGTFSTTYGSAGSDPFSAGSGTLKVTVDGKPITVLKVGAVTGADAKTAGRVDLFVIAALSATDTVIVSFNISSADLVQGATIPYANLVGAIWQQDKAGKILVLGGLTSGTLTLTKASLTKGEAVVGSFSATWAKPKQ
jgi:hypothetical protein